MMFEITKELYQSVFLNKILALEISICQGQSKLSIVLLVLPSVMATLRMIFI